MAADHGITAGHALESRRIHLVDRRQAACVLGYSTSRRGHRGDLCGRTLLNTGTPDPQTSSALRVPPFARPSNVVRTKTAEELSTLRRTSRTNPRSLRAPYV